MSQDKSLSVVDRLDKLLKKRKVIALNDFFMQLIPCHRTSKLLSQLYYWSRANNHREFWRPQRLLMRDIGMEPTERMSFYRSMRRIKSVDILNASKKAYPGKSFYRLNVQKLIQLLEEGP